MSVPVMSGTSPKQVARDAADEGSAQAAIWLPLAAQSEATAVSVTVDVEVGVGVAVGV